MAPSIIYSIGTLVEVDSTKTGYITEIDNSDVDNVLFKINYTVGNESEQGVRQSRCRPVNLRRATTTRSGTVRQAITLPSYPPPLVNSPPAESPIAPTGTPPIPIQSRQYDVLKSALKKSRTWMPSNLMNNPLHQKTKVGFLYITRQNI